MPVTLSTRQIRSMSPDRRTTRWSTRALPALSAGPHCRLLVVEDYRPGAEALAASLSLAGYETQFMLDGPAALTVAPAWKPDVIVLDINMPGMDGYEVARLLRMGVITQGVLIVAFTALDQQAVSLPGIAAGFDAYCQKGAAPEPLINLLQSIGHA